MSETVIAKPICWQAESSPSQAMLEAVYTAKPSLHPTVARIAARRIVTPDAVKAWFEDFPPLCDPFALPDMGKAIQRIRTALEQQQTITIFGDYDTDGITATTVMVQALQQCGAKVFYFIPDRETEGYGLTPNAVQRCLNTFPSTALLITVDCGISSVAEVANLNAKGVDVIITDHHVLPEMLPPAYAIVNPRRCAVSALQNMCGCATAFTVIRALVTDEHCKNFLDLVAVATIADVMALTGENRALVTRGLWVLSSLKYGNVGLKLLAATQKVDFSKIAQCTQKSHLPLVETVAFNLVPCLNAASRVGRFELAYNLLNTAKPLPNRNPTPAECARSKTAAAMLVEANKERRDIEKRLREHIDGLQLQPVGNVIIASGSQEEGFEPGVLGIVAARLADKYHLPAVVCCVKPDGSASGSMRANGPWHAVKALDTIADLCEHYGGHKAAAGFALKPGAFEAFATRLPEAFTQCQQEKNVKAYEEDIMHPLESSFYADLELLEPFGAGNPRPIFAKQVILMTYELLGAEKAHVWLRVAEPDDASVTYDAMWFSGARHMRSWQSGMRLRLFFTVSRDKTKPSIWKLFVEDAVPVPNP